MKPEQQISSIEVVKFGGVLMGCAENIRTSASYIASQPREAGILTVVSAAGGETDNLLKIAGQILYNESAEAQNETLAFSKRQQKLVDGLNFSSRDQAILLGEIYRSYEHIMLCVGLERFHPVLTDLILSQGERLSATIFSATLRNEGIDSEVVDAQDVIMTDSNFGNANPDITASSQLIQNKIGPKLREGKRVVMPGFYGKDIEGNITVMPRNSSDLSAALGAYALDANVLRLAKGIAGVYNKNPHQHDDAVHMKWLSYDLATEISNNGGKVIYPDVMRLMKSKDIPIVVFDPRNPVRQSIISKREQESGTFIP